MSEHKTSDRVEGKLEEIGGTLKKNLGHLVGNREMEAKGAAEELKGKSRQAIAEATAHAETATREAVKAVKALDPRKS